MKLLIKYLLILFVLFGNGILIAQSEGNPFELKHRIPKQEAIPLEEKNQVVQEKDLRQATVDNNSNVSSNPFDLREKTIEKSPIESVGNILPKIGGGEENAEMSKNMLFGVFLILLLFFTTIVSVARKRLEETYKAFLNDNFLRQIYRSNKGAYSFSFSYFLLYISFFLNLGVFIFLAANTFSTNLVSDFYTLALICLGVSIVFALKHLLLLFVSNIFPIDKEIRLYGFTIMLFNILLGLVLLPINILVGFAPESISKMAVYLGLGAILAIYGFRYLRGLSLGSRYLILHKFHFLLYLCAVEILPFIFLLKIILLKIA